MINIKNTAVPGKSDVLISLGIFLILTFGYFFSFGNYVLTFQETQSLFIFSGEYLHKFLLKPGGLLEYAAKFLTQFYVSKLLGPLILSVILTLPGLILIKINKKLLPDLPPSLLLILIPSMLLLLLQANYFHMMEHTLGFILVLLYYLFTVSSGKNLRKNLVIVLFPFFYYLAGAYIVIFAGMFVVHSLFLYSGKQRFLYPALFIITGAITFIIYWKAIFLQPVQQLLLNPLPLLEDIAYKIIFFILSGYLIFYSLISRKVQSIWFKRKGSGLYALTSTIITVVVVIFFLFRIYNPQTSRVIKLQDLVFDEKWNEAIQFEEKHLSNNLIGTYFYNVALTETNQLCDRLFFGSQNFGTESLVLPWGDVHLNRGAYFYYAVGLTNEAHRWAYEEMIVYGIRPQNVKILAKTCLINGDCTMARKYLGILKKTIYYRKWAKEYENLADNPELIPDHPELGAKQRILPKNNFFIQFNEPQNNLPLLFESQNDNNKAYEYYLAGLLLTKKVELAVNEIKNLKAKGYNKIPRHLEEAALIYYNSTGAFPDLGGLSISSETMTRFSQYFTAYVAARQVPSQLQQKMQQNFGNTFWYYFHFR